MSVFLGIDTSNYTTSSAAADETGVLQSVRRLLPVAQGERGLRQSDALFEHVRALPGIVEQLGKLQITAVGYSARPCDAPGSYMPVFLAGKSAACTVASLLGVPVYDFSHQAGHVRAALYSAGAEHLRGQRFLAFHVSGGTTDMLLCESDGSIRRVGGSADLHAGQLIDRIGVMLGLPFPCGPEIEKCSAGFDLPRVRPCVRELECNLSGFENKAKTLFLGGAEKGQVAAFALSAVLSSLDRLTENAMKQFGSLPVLFAGGVMSNARIRAFMEQKYGAYFASPAYASDNAAGTALLCRDRYYAENAK